MPAVIACVCILRGEVLLGRSSLEEGKVVLKRAGVLSGCVLGIDAADV